MSDFPSMPQHAARFADYGFRDIQTSPLMLYYEVTQACDLVCKHCRASAQPQPHAEELTTQLAKVLIDQASSFPKKPNMVFTGGDPLKRRDLFHLLEYAVARGLNVALTPSATPLATPDALRQARMAGVSALGLSLDAAEASTHDAFRGWEGSFARSLEILDAARSLGFYIQVNTTITRRNVEQIDAMAELLRSIGIHMWSVFFLVPVGRGILEERILPEEYEQVFTRLWYHAQHQLYAIKTTEAPHYRRYVLESLRREGGHELDLSSLPPRVRRLTTGIGDGRGIMFVSHIGEIYPAGFLPLACGRFPEVSIIDVYQNHRVFRELRDPDLLKGKCGTCAYRVICGGSRARAYAVTGDYLAAEPDCVFQCEPGRPLIPAS